MVKTDQLNGALYALQGVLVHARTMAYDRKEHRKIAELLDWAEYLPGLLTAEEDTTEQFRKVLSEIANQYQCQFILERFEQPPL